MPSWNTSGTTLSCLGKYKNCTQRWKFLVTCNSLCKNYVSGCIWWSVIGADRALDYVVSFWQSYFTTAVLQAVNIYMFSSWTLPTSSVSVCIFHHYSHYRIVHDSGYRYCCGISLRHVIIISVYVDIFFRYNKHCLASYSCYVSHSHEFWLLALDNRHKENHDTVVIAIWYHRLSLI